mmetsp:Transcript_10803/g.33353  ORF Transcript_10803/g.33353 Transcript_10803/m.33353 type:complete len:323 (-) Transcript_10803:80-1048(-)
MRDRHGVERGQCYDCIAARVECCEFVFSAYGGDDDDDGSCQPQNCSPEEYRRDPLMGCIRWRLERDVPSRPPPAACECCGCPAAAHEALEVSEAEARCLEVGRRLLAPLELSHCIRQSVQDTATLGLERENFTYGEVGLLSFLRLVERALTYRGAGAGGLGRSAFYDLGCGVGKCVIMAAVQSAGFARYVGVELLPGLCAASRALGARVQAEAARAAEAGGPAWPEVSFVEADLFEADVAEVTHVYVASLCFSDSMLLRLARKLAAEAHRLQVVAALRRFPLGILGFETGGNIQAQMTWTAASGGGQTVYLYRRRADAQPEL